MIPAFLRPYFWDIDTNAFDPRAHAEYTIERILELGDSKAAAWLREQFAAEEIMEVIRTTRRLTPRSATFWASVYEIPAHDVTVLR